MKFGDMDVTKVNFKAEPSGGEAILPTYRIKCYSEIKDSAAQSM